MKGKWVEGEAGCKKKKDKTIYIKYITLQSLGKDEETIKIFWFNLKNDFFKKTNEAILKYD